MTHLLDEITTLIESPQADRDQVERTLTDGYAHALALETERSRLQKRLNEVQREGSTQELKQLARRLDGTASDLSALRNILAQLRKRH